MKKKIDFFGINPTKTKPFKFRPVKLATKKNVRKVKRKNLTWPQAVKRYPKVTMFGDADRDGKLNMFDCKPFNKKRHGDIRLIDPMSKKGRRYQSAVRKKLLPEAPRKNAIDKGEWAQETYGKMDLGWKNKDKGEVSPVWMDRHSNNKLIVDSRSGKVVGAIKGIKSKFADIHWTDGDTGKVTVDKGRTSYNISNISIDKSERRKGYGRRAVKALTQQYGGVHGIVADDEDADAFWDSVVDSGKIRPRNKEGGMKDRTIDLENEDIPGTLYHGTTKEAAASILKRGLRPAAEPREVKSKHTIQGRTYVTEDKRAAKIWSNIVESTELQKKLGKQDDPNWKYTPEAFTSRGELLEVDVPTTHLEEDENFPRDLRHEKGKLSYSFKGNVQAGRVRTVREPEEESPEALQILHKRKTVETPENKTRRMRHGPNKITTINARKFKEDFEKARGTDLAWNEERLNSASTRDYDDAYPEVSLTRSDVSDGRHRISAAAMKGQDIDVADFDFDEEGEAEDFDEKED